MLQSQFNDNQHQAIKDAGLVASLNVLVCPTAAAIVYGKLKGNETFLSLICDNTLDISLNH